MNVVIFARGNNIKAQVEQGRKYAREKDHTVVAVIVAQGKELPEIIKGLGKEIDCVLIKDMARLSRRMHENLQIQHELETDCGVQIEVASEQPTNKATEILCNLYKNGSEDLR